MLHEVIADVVNSSRMKESLIGPSGPYLSPFPINYSVFHPENGIELLLKAVARGSFNNIVPIDPWRPYESSVNLLKSSETDPFELRYS